MMKQLFVTTDAVIGECVLWKVIRGMADSLRPDIELPFYMCKSYEKEEGAMVRKRGIYGYAFFEDYEDFFELCDMLRIVD